MGSDGKQGVGVAVWEVLRESGTASPTPGHRILRDTKWYAAPSPLAHSGLRSLPV